ncbi:MAG: transposase [Saprospiraceae bacterium]|nr:transposase [Saprospiraceae bacterium]
MRKNRRQHSAEFKSKVAIEALKEQKTLSQIAEQYALHANQICDWKKVLIEQSTTLFDKREKKESVVDIEALQTPFLEQIGLLQMEVAFLKKKLKQLGHP